MYAADGLRLTPKHYGWFASKTKSSQPAQAGVSQGLDPAFIGGVFYSTRQFPMPRADLNRMRASSAGSEKGSGGRPRQQSGL